jgi:hypothetical protein
MRRSKHSRSTVDRLRRGQCRSLCFQSNEIPSQIAEALLLSLYVIWGKGQRSFYSRDPPLSSGELLLQLPCQNGVSDVQPLAKATRVDDDSFILGNVHRMS